MTVVGFAVAGGRSQRMGEDKALLPWGETDLLGHTLLRLEKAVGDARILPGAVSRYEDRGSRVVLDGHVDQGPLAGLLAALDSAPGCGVLLLGVDLPLIPVELLRHLAQRLHGCDVVAPVSPRGPEPLCGAYGTGCLEPVRRRVAEGDLKMTAFWPDVRVEDVPPEDLAAFGDPADLFLNVNSPMDYDRARRRGLRG